MSRIAVVGSWHLAQVMAACFAEKGHAVRVVHDDAAAIESLGQGKPTVFEPGLEESIRAGLADKRLSFTTDFGRALRGTKLVFLCLDTPISLEGIDLGPVREAVVQVAKAAAQPYVLAVSSQVPVGTCEELQALARRRGAQRCEVVCNPEFLRLGGAMELQRHPDRIILGADEPVAAVSVERVYRAFERPVLTMSLREAEIVKHATNAYVATSVSFIGEIGQICDDYGADAFQVAKALKLDRRVGQYAYVRPGLGFNGGTVARDVKLLIRLAAAKHKSAPLMQAILDVNQRTNSQICERLCAVLKQPRGKTVGLLGLTYKAHTSTLRHSLTLQIAAQMLAQGMVLRAFDPAIPPRREGVRSAVHEWDVPAAIALCGSIDEAAAGAHALVVMTDKDEFKGLDLVRLGERMRRRVLVDAVSFYAAEAAAAAGFTYVTIGKGFRWR